MSRILINIPEKELNKLDIAAQNKKVSRSSVIRIAIANFIKEYDEFNKIDDVFGIFREKKLDALNLEKQLREEWEK